MLAFIINSNMPSGLAHPYKLDESVSNLWAVGCTFFILISF